MRRDPLGKFFLLALIVAVAGLAAVTRAPDAKWVERAAKAAVIGPWIERLADLYRRPAAAAEASDFGGGVEVIYRIDSRRNELRPTVVVEAGSAAGSVPPLGSEPALPLPIPSRPPDPEVLAAARELLAAAKDSQTLGPYTLYTDVRDRGLLIYLSAVAAQLESVYVSRYGLEPLPGAREAVVLFESEASYQQFLAGAPELIQQSAPGLLRSGVVATYSEGRGWSEVAATLIHELTHLVNKRALGPALPPWLDEGLADDLAQSRIEGLRIFPGTLGGSAVRSGSRTEYKGGQAAVIELGRAASAGDLPAIQTLLALDWESFQSVDRRSQRYGQSSFLVRSLLDSSDPGLATAFRGFLRDVSEGQEITGEALLNRLGCSWEVLDLQLASFVRRQAVEADLPI